MQFREFPKIARYSREVVVTEKIDGTNASIYLRPLPGVAEAVSGMDSLPHCPPVAVVKGWGLWAGSRSRWITADADNFGFAAWVSRNADALWWLGEGQHFGEWWGSGIQRGYGLEKGEKRFSLFNVARWADRNTTGALAAENTRFVDLETMKWAPACCRVVPTLCRINMEDLRVDTMMGLLAYAGSRAAPGFMKPEGIVIFHAQGNVAFKKTFEKDDAGKGREPVAAELTRAA